MLNKLRERTVHFMIIAFFSGLFIGINVSFLSSATEPSYKYLDYFHKVYQIIRSEYVDETSTKELFYGAIRGMIRALDDPFSRFLDEKAYAELKEMTTGKFVGVGIEISFKEDEVVVIAPIEDSPAMKAGIKAGDTIIKINGKVLKGMVLKDVVGMIKGLPNTKVNIHVRRRGYDEPFEFEMEREPIKIKSVEYGLIDNTGLGYMKIKSFGSDTVRDVTNGLKFFNARGVKKLIIDLRNNPGGLFPASIEIASLFLEKGQIIVSTRGREGSGRVQEYRSEIDRMFSGDLAVLINQGSASASEILSGALRDNKRAKLIGEKTFGKASVQKSYNFEEEVGIAITIAKYYTPSGELIHKKGINPDLKIQSDFITQEDKEGLRAIEKRKLLDQFAVKDMVYNAEVREKFKEFLAVNKIKLSENTANFILKNRLYRYQKAPLYDLEFDPQLNAALDYISKIQQ